MRRITPFLMVFALVSATALAAATDIGTVQRARGTAALIRDTDWRILRGGEAVHYADTLHTGTDSRMEVEFNDGSVLTLGDDAQMHIDEMVYEPGQRGRGAIYLAQGVFRMITGAINKVPGGTLSVTTPLAAIGVRGTDFWGAQTEDELTLALLDNGTLRITTDNGDVVVLTEPRTAVVIRRGQPIGEIFSLSDDQLAEAVQTVSW